MTAIHPAGAGRFIRLWRWFFANRLADTPGAPVPSEADVAVSRLLEKAGVLHSPLIGFQRTARVGSRLFHLPKFVFTGKVNGAQAVRVGIFGGLDSGSLDSVQAVLHVLERCEAEPVLAQDYLLAAYPKANVEALGPAARSYAHFQHRSATKPDDEDARFFQEELRNGRFSMLLFLRSDSETVHSRATVRGDLIGKTVVAPALLGVASRIPVAAEPVQLLPRHRAAHRAAGRANVLASSGTGSNPIEIELFAPQALPPEQRALALADISLAILARYRSLLSLQAML